MGRPRGQGWESTQMRKRRSYAEESSPSRAHKITEGVSGKVTLCHQRVSSAKAAREDGTNSRNETSNSFVI